MVIFYFLLYIFYIRMFWIWESPFSTVFLKFYSYSFIVLPISVFCYGHTASEWCSIQAALHYFILDLLYISKLSNETITLNASSGSWEQGWTLPTPDCYSDSTGEWIFPPYQSQQTRRCFSLVVAWSCSTRHTGRWGRPAGSPHWGPGHCCSVPLQRTNHSVFSISPPQTS